MIQEATGLTIRNRPSRFGHEMERRRSKTLWLHSARSSRLHVTV